MHVIRVVIVILRNYDHLHSTRRDTASQLKNFNWNMGHV